jgi:hypothetical protein
MITRRPRARRRSGRDGKHARARHGGLVGADRGGQRASGPSAAGARPPSDGVTRALGTGRGQRHQPAGQSLMPPVFRSPGQRHGQWGMSLPNRARAPLQCRAHRERTYGRLERGRAQRQREPQRHRPDPHHPRCACGRAVPIRYPVFLDSNRSRLTACCSDATMARGSGRASPRSRQRSRAGGATGTRNLAGKDPSGASALTARLLPAPSACTNFGCFRAWATRLTATTRPPPTSVRHPFEGHLA